jgi:hypothetical protein
VIQLNFNREKSISIIISFSLQCIIGYYLGHQYDMGIFLTVGHIVSKGDSPYGLFPASEIFNHPGFFEELPGVGYPPPWALLVGFFYSTIYKSSNNLFIYNLAIKLLSIASNVALALIMEKIADEEGIDKRNRKYVFYFFLFNPFFIYISAAWGQFDSLVILMYILSINNLIKKRYLRSALFLALSASLKIIPLIFLPIFLAFIKRNYNLKRTIEFSTIFLITSVSLSYIPFIIFQWNLDIIFNSMDVHFIRIGCFTLFNISDLLFEVSEFPQNIEFLGYLWIPSLILIYSKLSKTHLSNRIDLLRWSSSVIFILLLTRSWVSEQNIILLIPLALIQLLINTKKWRVIHLLWIIPFIFTFLNTSPFQLFFLISDQPLIFIRNLDKSIKIPRLILKFIIILPWQYLGWKYILETLHNPTKNKKVPKLNHNNIFVTKR